MLILLYFFYKWLGKKQWIILFDVFFCMILLGVDVWKARFLTENKTKMEGLG